jgi:hypothetical protein
VAVVTTTALAVAAAWLHRRELATEAAASASRGPWAPSLFDRRPRHALARLFERELLATSAGRVHLLLPGLFAVSGWLWLSATAAIEARGDTLPEGLAAFTARARDLPLAAILLFVVVWLGAEIWANQFGWSGRGLVRLLTLPVSFEDLLAARLQAIARFAAAQGGLALLPLLLIHRPTVVEVVAGVAGAGAALVVVVAAGHAFSARFPRLVSGHGSSTMPVYLSWAPSLTVVVVGLTGAVLYRAGELVAWWGPAAVMVAALVAVLAAYRRLLPRLAALVEGERERLVTL